MTEFNHERGGGASSEKLPGRTIRVGLGLVSILALLLVINLVGSPAGATHVPVTPPEGENVVWWGGVPVPGGTDTDFFERDGRTYMAVASLTSGFQIYDVTDREHPALVSEYLQPGYQNDVAAEGNLAILGTDAPAAQDPDVHHPPCVLDPLVCAFEGIELVDISNLTLPRRIAKIQLVGGAHTMTLVEDTVYVSDVSQRSLYIVNVADVSLDAPDNYEVVKRIAEPDTCADHEPGDVPCEIIQPGPGEEEEEHWDPHDVTGRVLSDGTHRLYVAAIDGTFIVDVDPEDYSYSVVSEIPNIWVNDPPDDPVANYQNISISHQADPSPDGKYLVVSDERGGGLTELICPGGGIHVYDITNPGNPEKLGVYFANIGGGANCTNHVYQFLPDRNVLTSAWYSAGTWVIDMNQPPDEDEWDNSEEIPGQKTTWGRTLGFARMPGADTWASKSPGLTADGRFFIYTDDLGRGMDIFEFTGENLPPPNPVQTTPTATMTGTPPATATGLPTLIPTATNTPGGPTATATATHGHGATSTPTTTVIPSLTVTGVSTSPTVTVPVPTITSTIAPSVTGTAQATGTSVASPSVTRTGTVEATRTGTASPAPTGTGTPAEFQLFLPVIRRS